jgi:hypothetical protein
MLAMRVNDAGLGHACWMLEEKRSLQAAFSFTQVGGYLKSSLLGCYSQLCRKTYPRVCFVIVQVPRNPGPLIIGTFMHAGS